MKPDNLRKFRNAAARRQFLEHYLKVKLSHISSFTFPDNIRNCENLIGAVQVPLGMAGPLLVKDSQTNQAKNYYLPLATTEAALVASVNRGCKAITLSGGAISAVEQVGVTRGPVFQTKNLFASLALKKWLEDHFPLLAKVAAKTSSHLKLKKLSVRAAGCYVYVRFYFTTAAAMGMNMATIAAQALVEIIEAKTKATCLALSGNFCVDKKPSYLNFLSGRGKRVWVEAVIKKKVVDKVLKTKSDKIYQVWLAKCLLGSAMSGSVAFNAHFANVVAAMFLATGQDLAHVVEGSNGITTTKLFKNGDLYISVYLPSLLIGTVGGGTGLPSQKEALAILGISKGADQGEQSAVLACLVGAAVLAGELSLLASLASGSLAKAHAFLAQGKTI